MNSAKVSISRGPLCLRLLLVRGASSSQKSNACDASGAEGPNVLGAVGDGVCTGCLRNGKQPIEVLVLDVPSRGQVQYPDLDQVPQLSYESPPSLSRSGGER